MKSCLIFFALAFFCATFFATPVYSKGTAANQITVSAYVNEHIGYKKIDDKISFSTNIESGFWILTKRNSFTGKEKDLYVRDLKENEKVIIIVAKI